MYEYMVRTVFVYKPQSEDNAAEIQYRVNYWAKKGWTLVTMAAHDRIMYMTFKRRKRKAAGQAIEGEG